MNKKMFTKLFALVLAVCALFSLAIVISSAAEADGTWTLVTDAGTLKAGDKVVIVAKDYDFALSTTQNSNNRGQAAITKSSDKNTLENVPSTVQVLTLEAGTTTGSFAFNTGSGYLYAASSSKNYLRTETELSANSSWKITITDGTASVVAQGSNTKNTMYYNQSSSLFSSYSNAQKAIVIYRLETAGATDPDAPVCEHADTTTTTVDATCTEDGSVTVTCNDCGETISTETITAPGHTGGTATCDALAVCDTCRNPYGEYAAHDFVDGSCTVCGEAEPTEATITFDDTSKKDSTVTTGMLWKENGIEVFVSSSNTYSNPLRCYKNSTVTITGTSNIAKIVFNANTTDYATTLKDTIGETAIADEKAVTVNLDGTSNTYEVTMSVAQVRIDSITVYYVNANAPVCKHTNTETVTEDATCHTAGSVTEVCVDCDTPVSSETIPAAHTIVNGVCSVCSMVEAPKAGVPYKFGMYQGKMGATYYIDGTVDGYYMNTVTDASAGITVYLEETDGGYYMYSFIEGVKTYIDMVVSGTYVNAVYVTTASTVYTIDETKNTVCATVGDDTRYFGTSNTGTYTTVGTTYSSGFVCQFYATGDVAKFNSASVTLGTDLGMIFKATVPAGVPTLTVEFNGKTYELTADAAGTVYSFNFKGIGPHQLALNIKATLKVDGVAVAEINNYSVEKNLNAIKSAEGASAALIELVNSVLIYGSESEKYLGIEEGVNADELTNDVAENDATYTFENADTFGFTAVGVNFDAMNRIYVKFFVKGDFTLTVNGTEVAVEATEDGYYKVYTDALNAKQFDDEFTFVITVGEETATLTYSVNAYAAAMKDDAEMGALAEALYAYGVKAKAYVG